MHRILLLESATVIFKKKDKYTEKYMPRTHIYKCTSLNVLLSYTRTVSDIGLHFHKMSVNLKSWFTLVISCWKCYLRCVFSLFDLEEMLTIAPLKHVGWDRDKTREKGRRRGSETDKPECVRNEAPWHNTHTLLSA